jgi:hypothetical protein
LVKKIRYLLSTSRARGVKRRGQLKTFTTLIFDTVEDYCPRAEWLGVTTTAWVSEIDRRSCRGARGSRNFYWTGMRLYQDVHLLPPVDEPLVLRWILFTWIKVWNLRGKEREKEGRLRDLYPKKNSPFYLAPLVLFYPSSSPLSCSL